MADAQVPCALGPMPPSIQLDIRNAENRVGIRLTEHSLIGLGARPHNHATLVPPGLEKFTATPYVLRSITSRFPRQAP
jgi:hypothetical protein